MVRGAAGAGADLEQLGQLTRGGDRANLGLFVASRKRRRSYGQSVAGYPAAAPGREAGSREGVRGPQA